MTLTPSMQPARRAAPFRFAATSSWLAAVFTAAVFSSAVLVFWIEPLFAKMILPAMGGAPAVWITALMFYQAVLFGGYVYAHLLVLLLNRKWQVAVHATLLALAGSTLSPALPAPLPGFTNPELQILATLSAGIGLPLLALSATAPLLQNWFSRTGHPRAHDPYFLYVASNIGSLGALLAFPFLLEPSLGTRAQSMYWTGGFILTSLLVLAAATLAGNGARPTIDERAATPVGRAGAPWLWLLLAAVPSSLLSGTTTRISTDIAAGPLFWVVPLALYLLTYILAFARRRILPARAALQVQAVLLVPVVIALFGSTSLLGEWVLVIATLLLLFVSAYLCHLRLSESRPEPARLTEFYLYVAAGGLLGGSFNALVAPSLFNDIVEFPIALVMAVALRPRAENESGPDWRKDLLPAAVAAALVIIVLLVVPADGRAKAMIGVAIAPALVALGAARARLAVGLAAACMIAALPIGNAPVLFAERNFFGIAKVWENAAGGTRVFQSGSTLHGEQSIDPALSREPTSYYHRHGPLGDAFRLFGERIRDDNVAIIGMGLGTAACYGPSSAKWSFYEINPAVIELATDRRYFSFLEDCQKDAQLVLGDGRLRFAESREPRALIVLDAFSSDSIPTHLLTLEAFGIYIERLDRNGLILAHVSNRFVDLRPTLAALANRLGLHAAFRGDGGDGPDHPLARPSEWVALTRNAADMERLVADAGWKPLHDIGAPAWTDDHSEILGPLLAKRRRGD